MLSFTFRLLFQNGMNLYFSGEHKKDDNLNNVCKTVDGTYIDF